MTGIELFFCGLSITTLVLSIWSDRLAYKHGIWDGAFNQFFPHVQDAMREYDRERANRILETLNE